MKAGRTLMDLGFWCLKLSDEYAQTTCLLM
jgi:hypothetical protein